ncbi:MAG TPA: hypothetical protein VMV03_13895 [Spirochaetia bacterium]|nr:hypothetical protein [Spirochaetia bacterium]
MPSSSFFRTASKRSDGRIARAGAVVVLAALALAGVPRAAAQSLDLAVTVREDTVRASLSFSWNREAALIASLRDGLESRVVFTLRVYQKRSGFLPFPRDRLLSETVIARSAYWDFLDRKFVVEADDGVRTAYEGPNELLRAFLSVKDYPVYRGWALPRTRYVSARAHIEPVRLMPPLTIVSLAGTAASYTTPWKREEAP